MHLASFTVHVILRSTDLREQHTKAASNLPPCRAPGCTTATAPFALLSQLATSLPLTIAPHELP